MNRSLDIPGGSAAVRVSVIDSTRMRLPSSHLLEPSISQHQTLDIPSFSFLIEHPGLQRKVLFDLGLRKDVTCYPPAVAKFLAESGWELHVQKDIREILMEEGCHLSPKDINAIIFSHHHFDHVGNLSQFPITTEVVVGPGFKSAYLPGWPVNPDSSLIDEDWKRREVREISFDHGNESLSIGGFRADDYLGDGSLFLLDAPGHTVGHLAALARVDLASGSEHARDKFVLLGGDICHYPGVFRPTRESPLSPEAQSSIYACPPSFFLEIHPEKSCERPYYKMPTHCTVNKRAAEDSIKSLCKFDADEDVLVIISHDASLIGKFDFFPKSINGWDSETKRALQWAFIADFCN